MGHNDRMSDADYKKLLRSAKRAKRETEVLFPNKLGEYGDYGLVYWEKGFKAFPAQNKKPLVSKATGHDGEITIEKVLAWVQDYSYRFAHVSLRAEGWIGIDVDNYDGKQGAKQLEELEERLGVLPDTYTSTSRGAFSESRQYIYRVPDDTPRKSKAAKDIEIIQRCHRNTAAYPTYHRKTGQVYRWYNPDGTLANEIPRLEDIPFLPEPWLDYLARGSGHDGDYGTHDLFQGDLTPWALWLGDGEPSEAYLSLIECINANDHIGHDLLGFYLQEIHDLRSLYGESGGLHALSALHDLYFESTNDPNPEKEWDDWIRWILTADWVPTEVSEQSLLSGFIGWVRRLGHGGANAS